MKDLKKLHLKNAKELTKNEMKQVVGGEISSGASWYLCTCYHPADESGVIPEGSTTVRVLMGPLTDAGKAEKECMDKGFYGNVDCVKEQ